MRTHSPSSVLPGYSSTRNTRRRGDISEVIASLRERYLVIFQGEEPSEGFLQTIAQVLVGTRDVIYISSYERVHAVRLCSMALLGDYFVDKIPGARGKSELLYHAYPENDLQKVFHAIQFKAASTPVLKIVPKVGVLENGSDIPTKQEPLSVDPFVPLDRLATAGEARDILNSFCNAVAANDSVLMKAFKGIL